MFVELSLNELTQGRTLEKKMNCRSHVSYVENVKISEQKTWRAKEKLHRLRTGGS